MVDSHAYTAGEVLWQSGWVSTSEVTMDGCSRDYKVGFYIDGSAQSNTSATMPRMTGTTRRPFSTGISSGRAIKTETNAGPYDNVMPIDNTYHNGDGNKTHHAMAPPQC